MAAVKKPVTLQDSYYGLSFWEHTKGPMSLDRLSSVASYISSLKIPLLARFGFFLLRSRYYSTS